MTQQELADKLNVTDRAVSHWENGRRLPDYSLLSELCVALSVSINELFDAEIKYIETIDDEAYFSVKHDKKPTLSNITFLLYNDKNKRKIIIDPQSFPYDPNQEYIFKQVFNECGYLSSESRHSKN